MSRFAASIVLALGLSACAASFGSPTGTEGDADGDGISDVHEDRESGADLDQDGTPDYLDTDSDGDCIPDAVEAGDSDLATAPRDVDGDLTPDFRDLDSDGDGLADGNEDKNCNGVADAGETSAVRADTDEDGATDLVEAAAGTDSLDPADNPQANGDFVFVMPYNGTPSPRDDDLDFATELKAVDLYVLVDRSGSMSDEISSIRNNMASVVDNLRCAPGQETDCVKELWTGVGSFTYYERNSFIHHLDVQPDSSQVYNYMPGVDTGNCNPCAEPHLMAVTAVASGQGSGSCQIAPYQPRYNCTTSPAGDGGIGYACFRPTALPVIILATDEPFVNGCATIQDAATAAYNIGAKVIGLYGNSEPTVVDHLSELARLSGAVDSAGNPLVFNGTNAAAAPAIEEAVRTVTNNLPLDIGGRVIDDPADDVDVAAEFIDHVEVLQNDSPLCSSGLAALDSDGDGFDDVFTGVVAGTPLCWRVVPKQNTTVTVFEPTLFRASLDVYGDDVTLLDSRNVFFVVPPQLGPTVD